MVEFKCKSCGHVQEPDPEWNNENWETFSAKCPECGGQVGPVIDGEDEEKGYGDAIDEGEPGVEVERHTLGNPRSMYYSHVQPYLQKIAEWRQYGVSKAEIARNLKVSAYALYRYEKKYPELADALNNTGAAVNELRSAAFQRATGMTVVERTSELRKILDKNGRPVCYVDPETGKEIPKMELRVTKVVEKQIPPDSQLLPFMLANLDPEHWRFASDLRKKEPEQIPIEERKALIERVRKRREMEEQEAQNGAGEQAAEEQEVEEQTVEAQGNESV